MLIQGTEFWVVHVGYLAVYRKPCPLLPSHTYWASIILPLSLQYLSNLPIDSYLHSIKTLFHSFQIEVTMYCMLQVPLFSHTVTWLEQLECLSS